MKKYMLVVMAMLALTTLMFAELMQPTKLLKEATVEAEYVIPTRNLREDAPEFNFNVPPMTIMNTFYDYFPGGYESIPIRVQPSPAGGHEGGGIYIAFQATPVSGGTRRVYYVYIKDGQIESGPALIDLSGSASEGFPGIDIDMETGNPFVSWHTANPNNPSWFHCPIIFDEYNMIGTPGLWSESYGVIDNPYDINGEVDQEFIWPSVFIGPAPTEGMRRVYVVGKNYVENVFGHPAENALIAYADFMDPSELAFYDSSQWTEITIPALNEWRNQDIRTFRSFIASREDGTIAVVGHSSDLSAEEGFGPNDFLFVVENSNYGEGDWEVWTADPTINVGNPDNYFVSPDTNLPYEDMRYSPYVNRHNVVIDDLGNYHFIANYTLSSSEGYWFPNLSTTKHIKFNRSSGEFSINDLYPRRDESPYTPWDNPPVYEGEGDEQYMLMYASYPYYWHDTEDLFHENYFRIIQDGPYMVALFQESLKARYYHLGWDDYAPWASAPETFIYLSKDYGTTWSEPIILNSVETPEFAGLIPTYWYMADNIEMLNDGWARLHMFFTSQNDYGSAVQENSPNTGAVLKYTSLDVDFSNVQTSTEQVVKAPQNIMLKQNYPNPFNPETTISFSLPANSNVALEVYNIKGQLVKTLYDGVKQQGEHSVVWNGSDNNNNEAASGLYFYRLTTDEHTEMRKMLLVK